MLYSIETPLRHFLQCLTLTQTGDVLAYPRVAQIRGDCAELARIEKLLTQAKERMEWAENNFHEEPQARLAYEGGDVLHSPGTVPFTVLMQSGKLALLGATTVLFEEVRDVDQLLEAVKAAHKKLR